MNDAIDRAVGRAWRDPYPWEFLTRLTELDDRMGGHPGERRAAELVADAFETAGMAPSQPTFEMARWERGHADLAIRLPERDLERSFETLALPYSPAGEVRGELVDVGYGSPEEIDEADLAGNIALASTTTPSGQRFVHRMEKYGHAAAAGAAAFVFANHVPGQLPPTGSLRFDGEAAIPGVGVSKETGDWLREYARTGAECRLSVDARTEPGTSRNVVGTLGPDTDEEVVLLAHYDAHDITEGALDNGCGIAVVVAAARVLSSLDLDRRVRIAGVGCEEIGLLGSEALAADLDPDSVAAVVNVDGAGRHRDFRARTQGVDTLADAVETVADTVEHPATVDPTPHPYSDHWPFLRAGVPAVQLRSRPPDGGDRGRGWGHTRADTRDKVDARLVREHGVLTALLVRELAGREAIGRVDTDRLAADLRDNDAEAGMRAAEIWPTEWT